MQITISALQIPNWQGSRSVELRIYASEGFIDASNTLRGTANPFRRKSNAPPAREAPFFQKAGCTLDDSGNLTVPAIVLPSTTDSITDQTVRYSAYFFDAQSGLNLGSFPLISTFALGPAPTTLTWLQVLLTELTIISESADMTEFRNFVAISLTGMSDLVTSAQAAATAAASSEAELEMLVQPLATIPVSKVVGASPEAMPEFQLVNQFRLYNPIGKTYYRNRLRTNDVNEGFFAGFGSSGITPGTTTYAGNGLTVQAFTGQAWNGVCFYKRLQTPFEVGSVYLVTVPTYSTGLVSVHLGLINSPDNWLQAFYDFSNNKLSVRVCVAGTVTVLGEVATGSNLAAGDRLSLVLMGPFAYALQIKPDGTEFRSGVVNLKPSWDPRNSASVQEGFQWSVGAQTTGAGNIAVFRDFEVSWFGGVGMRDFSLVKYEDGTPYEEEGLYYLTADIAGLYDGTGDAPFASGSAAVFTFDPLTHNMEMVGRLFWKDQASGVDYVCAHQSPQILFNRVTKIWQVTATSFGLTDRNSNIKIVSDSRYTSPLRGTHVLNSNYITFPGGPYNGMWDAQWMLVSGTWYIAVTVDDGTGKSKVGLFTAAQATPFTVAAGSFLVHTTANAREATKLVNTGGGTVRLLAGETNTSTVYVYTLSPFAQIGSFAVPASVPLGLPAQHFDMLQHFNKGLSEYFAFLFGIDEVDSISNSWGSTLVLRNGNGGELPGLGFDKIKAAGRPA